MTKVVLSKFGRIRAKVAWVAATGSANSTKSLPCTA